MKLKLVKPKLTKKTIALAKRRRARIVEILRCAADDRWEMVGINGVYGATEAMGVHRITRGLAWVALIAAGPEVPLDYLRHDEEHRQQLLEAAQLVEEGSWP